MPPIVEPIKEGFTAWEKWLPMGAYLLLIHKTGAGLEAWLKERGVPAEWAPTATDLVYATAAYGLSGMFPDYKETLTIAGHVAMGLAVLHTVLVFWPSSEGRSEGSGTKITKKSD